jgi:hypothetical protein
MDHRDDIAQLSFKSAERKKIFVYGWLFTNRESNGLHSTIDIPVESFIGAEANQAVCVRQLGEHSDFIVVLVLNTKRHVY